MAFTPEDGTGVSGANSYLSLAEADSYWSDRGDATWTAADDDDKEAALLKATSFLDGSYRGRWIGQIASTDQGLSWPRDEAIDPDGRELTGVPSQIAEATAMLAREALSGDLAPVIDMDRRVKRQKLGPLEKEFAVENDFSGGKRYPFLGPILTGLLTSGRNNIMLRRG